MKKVATVILKILSKKKTQKLGGNNKIGNKNVCNITANGHMLNTGRTKNENIGLIENCDKYDLELRFKPKHWSKIHLAKANSTFQKWDNQIKGKFGFIPLGDLVLPNSDKKPSL